MTQIKSTKLIHSELTYKTNGFCFKVHYKLGRFKSERQYCDEMETLLKVNNWRYKREFDLSKINPIILKGNKVDFYIEDLIIVDFKAKKFITKEDYIQMLRYLESANLQLGIIYNFRNTYLKPKRIINSKFNLNT
jgi:GxxExxY protein